MRWDKTAVYQDVGQAGFVGAPTVPTVMVYGATYNISIPISWTLPEKFDYHWWYPSRYEWKTGGTWPVFVFSIRVNGGPELLIQTIQGPVPDQLSGSHIFTVPIDPAKIGLKPVNGWESVSVPPRPTPYTFHIRCEVEGLYEKGRFSPWDPLTMLGTASTSELMAAVTVISGVPDASFVAEPTTGEAPLTVQFVDTSLVPAEFPITSREWSFGDGKTSTLRDPVHVFTAPGAYTVTLTVSNALGSDSFSSQITVAAAVPFPIFAPESWCPSAINVGDPFSPRLVIKNQGGPGNIWITCTAEARTTTIVSSLAVPGYADYTYNVPACTIDGYIGYTPTTSKMVELRWQTGPVGAAKTGEALIPPQGIAVMMEEVPPEEVPAYTCPYCGATFATKSELDAHIAEAHPEAAIAAWDRILAWLKEHKTAAAIGGGGLAGVGAYLLWPREKQ